MTLTVFNNKRLSVVKTNTSQRDVQWLTYNFYHNHTLNCLKSRQKRIPTIKIAFKTKRESAYIEFIEISRVDQNFRHVVIIKLIVQLIDFAIEILR